MSRHSARTFPPPARPVAVLAAAMLALSFFVPGVAPVSASQSEAYETEGATIRLVTSGLADSEGRLRGALEIRLKPGWKTYWRDPGASGVPPRLDVARGINVDAAEIAFPRPAWHADDYGSWAGYDQPVSLPVTFRIPRPRRYSLIEADIFLGVCQTICVPVQASLTVEPGAAPDDPDDARAVAAAFASLPRPAEPGFRVSSGRVEADRLIVEVELPDGGAGAELFLAGDGGYAFSIPKRSGRTPDSFEIGFVSRKPGAQGPARIDYTLATLDDAVSGVLELP